MIIGVDSFYVGGCKKPELSWVWSGSAEIADIGADLCFEGEILGIFSDCV